MPARSSKKKGPGGRPKKAKDERRLASTRADLTLAEKQFVSDQAKAAGMSEAAFVRNRVLGLPVSPRKSKTDARLVHEINMVGVNLMQYIRDDRFGRGHRSPADWDELYKRLAQVLDMAVENLQ